MTANEGRWDYSEGDDPEQYYDKSELEKARTKLDAEKGLLDKTERSRFPVKGGMDYQEGGEDFGEWDNDESPMSSQDKEKYELEGARHDMQMQKNFINPNEMDKEETGFDWQKGGEQENPASYDDMKYKKSTLDQAEPTEEDPTFGFDYQKGEEQEEDEGWGSPEETAKDIYDLGHPEEAEEEEPVEKWDKDDDIGRNYAEPTGDDEPLDDDSYWQGRMEEAEKQFPLTSTGMAEEPQEEDDGTTIANSGHRSTYSDYSLGKEYDPSGEPDLMSKDEKKVGDYFDNLGEEEAPDDIDPIFGKAEEESSISVSGPPANTQPPANMFDDEEEEAPIGEAGTNPEESWNILSDDEKEGDFGDWLGLYSDDEDKFAQNNYGKVPYDQLPQSFKSHLGGEAKLKSGYIQCPHCDQQFSNIQWLADHIDETHEGIEANEDFHSDLHGEYIEYMQNEGSGTKKTYSEWLEENGYSGYMDNVRSGAFERIDEDLATALSMMGNPEYPPDEQDHDALLALGLVDQWGKPTAGGAQALQDHYGGYGADQVGAQNLKERPDIIDDFSQGTRDYFSNKDYYADNPEEFKDRFGWGESIANILNETEFKEDEHPREDTGKFTSGGGGSGGKHSETSDKDIIKSIKGGNKDWHSWGRTEKNEELYAELERRNREVPKPTSKLPDKVFRDDPDAVSKMEKKVKYWEDQKDYWTKIIKFPSRDYQTPNQLGDARWFMGTNISTNLRDAKKKLEGIKSQQGRGTDLVRKPTYKDGKKRFYYSEEPKGEPKEEPWQKGGESKATEQRFEVKCPSCGETKDLEDTEGPGPASGYFCRNCGNYFDNIDLMDVEYEKSGEAIATEQDGWWECNDCSVTTISEDDKTKHELETGHDMYHAHMQPVIPLFKYGESRLSWEYLPRDTKEKLGEGYTPVTESEWNTSTPEQRKEMLKEVIVVSREVDDDEELALLSQLLDNELEEQAQGEDETEDIAIVANLIGEEEFKEDEHPREDTGKFTSGGGSVGKKEPKGKSPNEKKNFDKAKTRAMKGMTKPEGSGDNYHTNQYNQINNLDGFPTHSSQLRGAGVSTKAPIMKAHLQTSYPNNKWSVRTEYFSMGSAIDAHWKGDGGYPYGASDQIAELYSNSGASNMQVDYSDTDNYVHLYDGRPREERHEWDPQTLAKSRKDRFGGWLQSALPWDQAKTWAYSIADDYIKSDGKPDHGWSGVDKELIAKTWKEFREQENKEGGTGETPIEIKKATTPAFHTQQYMGDDPKKPQEIPIDPATGAELPVSKYNPRKGEYPISDPTSETPEDVDRAHKQMLSQKKSDKGEPWQRKGEGYSEITKILKKSLEFEDSDRKVSPNTLQRYSEPIDLPNGKNALDQTYGVSEPETPDGQDLTGITVGEEEIKEQKPFKPTYLYYKQYPFGRRAGTPNPFGESYSYITKILNEVDFKEEEHPREEAGKFTSKGGGSSGGKKDKHDQLNSLADKYSKAELGSKKNQYESQLHTKLDALNKSRDFVKDGHYIVDTTYNRETKKDHGSVRLMQPDKLDLTYPNASTHGGMSSEYRPHEFEVGGKMVKVGDTIEFEDSIGDRGIQRILVSGFSYDGDEWEGPSVNGYVTSSSNTTEHPKYQRKMHGDHRVSDVRRIVSSSNTKMKSREAYSKEQVSIDIMDKAHIWWDNTYPERQWSDMRISDRQRAIYAFLRDPDTTIDESHAKEQDYSQGYTNPAYDMDNKKTCDNCNGTGMIDEGVWNRGIPVQGEHSNYVTCPKCDGEGELGRNYDGSWISTHDITKWYGDESYAKEELSEDEWDNLSESERLSEMNSLGWYSDATQEKMEDWATLDWRELKNKTFSWAHVRNDLGEGGQGSGRKPQYASKTRPDKAHVGWKNYGIDDYLDKAEKDYEEGKEQLEDPTPWVSLAHLAGTTVKDILFPEKEESKELSLSDMTDEQMEELGKKESEPHKAEDLAEEGGKGSGKKDHKGWMRAIEEEHTYDFCENCSMITEQVNHKCDMCGKKVGTEGRFSEIVWCDKCNKKVGEYEYSDVGDGYQNLAESLYYEVLREHEKKVH